MCVCIRVSVCLSVFLSLSLCMCVCVRARVFVCVLAYVCVCVTCLIHDSLTHPKIITRIQHKFLQHYLQCCSMTLQILMSLSHTYIHTHTQNTFQYCCKTRLTGWQRLIGSLIAIGHFPQKSLTFSGSFVENDLQLRGSY